MDALLGLLVFAALIAIVVKVKKRHSPLSPMKQKYEVDFDDAWKWAPGCSWLVVAGSYYRQGNAVAAMRSVKCHAERLTWRITPERTNKVNPNALAVFANGKHVGYIADVDLEAVTPVITAGGYQVLIRKVYVEREGFPEYTLGIAIPREAKR